jgi:hypothetical protein
MSGLGRPPESAEVIGVDRFLMNSFEGPGIGGPLAVGDAEC